MLDIGKTFTLLALVFLLSTLILNIMPTWQNKLRIPWDIYIDKPRIKIYIPWLSSLIISVILTLIFNFFRR